VCKYATALITDVECFIVQVPGIKCFFSLLLKAGQNKLECWNPSFLKSTQVEDHYKVCHSGMLKPYPQILDNVITRSGFVM